MSTQLAWLVIAVLAALHGCRAGCPKVDMPDMSWEEDYAYWRKQEPLPLADWRAKIPHPKPTQPILEDHLAATVPERHAAFTTCINKQAKALSERVLSYRPPRLNDIRRAVDDILKQRNLKVSVAIFWGRERYVSVLWKYLERNLRPNGGVVDELLLVTYNRDNKAGAAGARAILTNAIAKYPKNVFEREFCSQPYGCAFDSIMNDPHAVYIKLDDDIVFIKDGSFEHLAYQVLTNNDEYTLFSGSVVNNPHGQALHRFVGAYPPTTYHWKHLGRARPPFYNYSTGAELYYGKNVYDLVGARAHEAFIYNVARGRLDVYGFDLWNINECRCGVKQEGLDMCSGHGYYRWSINAIAWSHNVSSRFGKRVPSFDEPAIGIGWVQGIAPYRAAIVGEALFVHCQYTRQRTAKPDFGLREEILLPWYHQLAGQYVSGPYGGWAGNASLLTSYEDLAYSWGEERFCRFPVHRKPAGGELLPDD